MAMLDKLNSIRDRHAELAQKMTEGVSDPQEFQSMSKEYASLGPVVEIIESYQSAVSDLADAKELLSEPDMKEMAQEEILILEKQVPELEHQLKIALLPKDEADDRNVICEIRAGAGGDEAALFAGDIFRMYQRYAGERGWKVEVLDTNESDVGGYNMISFAISGDAVFSRMKYESGGHRVQRVPETESGGRIHTSAATVAVLPEAQDVDIHIDPSDLRVDTYRASGAGGQHVNTTDSAIRITHEPTGVVVQCQDGRSQHKNKEQAMKMLRAKLYEVKRAEADAERAANRKSQVGSGDRSERIRTYNFPQGRVSDHRINLTLHKLEKVLLGEALDEIIDAIVVEEQAEQLANLGD